MNKIVLLISKNKLFYSSIFIAILGVFYFQNQHDYFAYVNEWDKIFNGANPYNAYGLVFNFFSFPNSLHNKLPKLIFIITYFIAIKKIVEFSGGKEVINRILLINPLFWIFGVAYGSNDIFVSSITLLAIINLINHNKIMSGILFALSVNLKFTPLSIFPFLIIKKNMIKTQIIIPFLLFTILFFAVGFYFWGIEIMNGFMFNINRESSIFSIFRFVSGKYEPFGFFGVFSLDFLSIYLVIIAWITCFICFILFNLDKYLMLLLAYSNVILFYKSGHHQFYILLFMLTILVYIIHNEKILRNKTLLHSFIFFWSWIFLATILYPLTDEFSGVYHIREWIAFPTFIIHSFVNIQLILHIIRNRSKLKKRINFEKSNN